MLHLHLRILTESENQQDETCVEAQNCQNQVPWEDVIHVDTGKAHNMARKQTRLIDFTIFTAN
ncbi:uncharacterized protein MEPE_02029 [Melanopsichium pennsylvanicum]|uniref:Uncharacterized protein n=1 Tax=Melanopsichium pennsylvanicum TaxID=63383 RepID=A0AAJ4XJV6_9BASI|nr:uncharacterized protein MEPE_02029 [Melanopsichium pennsylvanicum]